MLGVNSQLELFTQPLAWQQYQMLWQVLTSTGIVLLPFFRVTITNASQVFLSPNFANAASPVLRKTLYEIILMLIVVTIALYPIVPLDSQVLQYAPQYNLEGQRVNADNTSSTFRGAQNIPRVQVPILYYGILSVSYGITHAMIAGLSEVKNLRQIQAELNASNIEDSALRAEVADFYNQCWKPAYAKYIKEKIDLVELGFKVDDANWLGSHFFLTTRGYYDLYYSHQPIKNFTISAIDDDFEAEWGRPHCKNWWSAQNYGLGSRLSKELPKSFLDYIHHYTNDSDLYERAIRRLIDISFPSGIDVMGDEHSQGRHHISKKVTSKVGMFWHSLSAYPKMYIIISSLPVIQALLNVAIIIALPIFAILASFRLQAIISAGAAISSIIFWKYLWEFVNILDDMLIRAFYPTSHLEIGGTNTLGEYIVDLVTLFMYIVFPLALSTLMSWAGWSSGAGIAGYLNQSFTPIAGAGDKAGSATTMGAGAVKGLLK